MSRSANSEPTDVSLSAVEQLPFAGPVRMFVYVMYALGFLSRVVPIFDEKRMFWQFPTEDGYLMLTIARNLALGHGMSTSAGLIPTNGTQPLFNFVEAFGFIITGNDRASGVRFTLIVSVLVVIFGAWLVERAGRLVLQSRPWGSNVAKLGAALWFASPFVVNYSMNCLETGLYTVLGICSVGYWLKTAHGALHADETEATRTNLSRALVLGVFLGLTFWARIDAVFLIATLTLANLLIAVLQPGLPYRARVIESVATGALSVLIASPWLIFNKMYFGHFTPISGIAQGMNVFGGNLKAVPSKLFEYATMIAPVPHTVEEKPWVLVVTTLVFIGYIAIVARMTRHANALERVAVFVCAAHVGLLVAYYGLLFGAPYFLSRYFAPMSGYTAVITPAIVATIWATLRAQGKEKVGDLLASTAGLAAVGLCLALAARTYVNGTGHMHIQVVRWVEANVPEQAWLGAIQTGTVGFFHDRTVNLDGKVNPDALKAQQALRLQEYVATEKFGPEGAQIEYLADWHGFDEWMRFPAIANNFEIVVSDEALNLSAMRRKRNLTSATR